LPEDLYPKDVCDDLLALTLEVRMDEGDVVVGADDVAEGGEAFFYSLNFDAVGDGVAEVLEFLVGCCCGD
jgi:hypothetical protein